VSVTNKAVNVYVLGSLLSNTQTYNTVARRVASRQRRGKHVPAATDKHAKIEILLETVFLLDPCKVVIRRTIEVGREPPFRGLEHRSKGIAIVKSRYQETYINILRTLVCVL
jgi:hypothetical protein